MYRDPLARPITNGNHISNKGEWENPGPLLLQSQIPAESGPGCIWNRNTSTLNLRINNIKYLY